MTTATGQMIQTAQIEELVASLLARGCGIEVNQYGLVKVSGDCDFDDVMTLQNNSKELKEIIRRVAASAEPKVDELNIRCHIAKWQAVCTAERGYDWSISNWLTEKYHLELESDIVGWQKLEVSLKEVHESFSRWAEAHKRDIFVTS